MDIIEEYERKELERIKAGSVDGAHSTTYIERVKHLKREKNHAEAIALLFKLIDATERESSITGLGVAPWYYEQLAILYRKENFIAKEIEILERYNNQNKATGAKPSKLNSRLEKA
ncbi:hypothetical protein [Bacterioplanoides sp.]|uniref:hypothetical protein n=1 Tax=Bacterioplanoides sp. TaxID=2066072 RepID=UPI003B5CE5A7